MQNYMKRRRRITKGSFFFEVDQIASAENKVRIVNTLINLLAA